MLGCEISYTDAKFNVTKKTCMTVTRSMILCVMNHLWELYTISNSESLQRHYTTYTYTYIYNMYVPSFSVHTYGNDNATPNLAQIKVIVCTSIIHMD